MHFLLVANQKINDILKYENFNDFDECAVVKYDFCEFHGV